MKSKITTFLLIAISVFFIRCDEREKELSLDLDLASEDQFGFPSEGRPSNAISYQELVSMLHEYDLKRSEILESRLGEPDNRSVFFSKRELIDFFNDVERLSVEKNIKVTGFTIYNAVHPNDALDQKKRNKSTLIIMPNTVRGNNYNVAFDPSLSEKNKPAYFDEELNIFEHDEKVVPYYPALEESLMLSDRRLKYGEIKKMLTEYKETKASYLNKYLGREGTRKSIFKAEDLKAYLGYLDSESIKRNIVLSGIEIMFGVYPENYQISPIKRGYQNLILMPTTKISDRNEMFDPIHSQSNQPALLKELLENKYNYHYDASISVRKNYQFNFAKNNDLSSGGNRAGISPPL